MTGSAIRCSSCNAQHDARGRWTADYGRWHPWPRDELASAHYTATCIVRVGDDGVCQHCRDSTAAIAAKAGQGSLW